MSDAITEATHLLRDAVAREPRVRLPLAILQEQDAASAPGGSGRRFDADDLDDLLHRLDRDRGHQLLQDLSLFLASVEGPIGLALHTVVVGLADLPPAVARGCLIELKPVLRSIGLGDGF